VRGAMAALGTRVHVSSDLEGLARELTLRLRPGDHALIMSNGGFGGLHARLLEALAARAVSAQERAAP